MSCRFGFPDYRQYLRREDLKRIWMEYNGLVREELLRELIGEVTGEPQPDRGPVTVMDDDELIYLYDFDPLNGDKLFFMPLCEAEEWAPVAAAAEIAGTWARFVELGGDRASSIRESLAEHARYPDFESFRDGDPNDLADSDDADQARGDPVLPEAELCAAYAELDCPRDRGPLDDEPMDRCELINWEEDRILEFSYLSRAMLSNLPACILRDFVGSYCTDFDDGPYAEIKPEDHDAILAAFARLGFTVIRDDMVIRAFWGLETDLDAIRRRLDSYREVGRLLWEVGGGGEDEDDDEDDEDDDD